MSAEPLSNGSVGFLVLEKRARACPRLLCARARRRQQPCTPSEPPTHLLLELAGEAGLDLVESLELGDGDEDDNSLLATLDVDLLGGGDLEDAELGLELGNVVLEVKDGLGDGLDG